MSDILRALLILADRHDSVTIDREWEDRGEPTGAYEVYTEDDGFRIRGDASEIADRLRDVLGSERPSLDATSRANREAP